MDANSPSPDDRLNELERRLSVWKPAADGLDADRMLYAAGRASARAGIGRFIWPSVAACTTLVAVGLGGWLAAERSERLALAQLLQQQAPLPSPVPDVGPSPMAPWADPLPGSGYLAARRALEQGLDAWPTRGMPEVEPPDGAAPSPPVLQVWQRNRSLDL